jgi:TonB family protein
MKEEDKNRKTDLSDLLRYHGTEMTGKERNAFERKLQKDPFAEEAAEGFSVISSDETLKDIERLKRKLKSRVSRQQRVMYFRIAASVAVLMLISSIFFLSNRSKNADENVEIALNTTTPLEIAESKAILEPVIPASEAVKADRYEKQYKDKVSETVDELSMRAGQEKADNNIKAIIYDSIGLNNAVTENVYLADRKEAELAPASAMARIETSTKSIKGRVISSEDNLPLPGVSVMVKGTNNGVLTDTNGNFSITVSNKESQTLLASFIGMEPKEFKADADTQLQVQLEPSLLALNEVVVVGYGVSKSKKVGAIDKEAYDDTGYTAPEPAGGQLEFDRYIEKNIQKPASQAEGERAVVILNFTVMSDGTIDNIIVIRSPGQEHSAEAMRLIRVGPSWKPAVHNGEKIDDEVRVRIVFK